MTLSKYPKILLTGATGNTGYHVAQMLSAHNIPFRAMTRSVEGAIKLSKLPFSEPVIGDFNEPCSVYNALKGIEKVFLLTNSTEKACLQQMDFVDAAVDAGVEHIIKQSQWAADANSPYRFLEYHGIVENHIQHSDLAYTFLRPNQYFQGLFDFKYMIAHQGRIYAAIGDAPISMVDARDVAGVAVQALIKPGHENKIYDLTGPESLTHSDIASAFSRALGKEVNFINVLPEEMLQGVLNVGFPEWQAHGIIEDYAHYFHDEAAFISNDILEVTGLPACSFQAFLSEYTDVFKNVC